MSSKANGDDDYDYYDEEGDIDFSDIEAKSVFDTMTSSPDLRLMLSISLSDTMFPTKMDSTL